MPKVSKMNADLMLASSLRPEPKQCEGKLLSIQRG